MKAPKRPGDLRLQAAVEALLESYASVGGINQIDGLNLPSLARVVEAIQLLEAILFPGYYEKGPLGRRNARYVIGERCARLQECLSEQIARSLEEAERRQADRGTGGAVYRAADGASGGASGGADDGAAGGTTGGVLKGPEARVQAERIAFELLEALPAIREMLREDAQAALEGDPAARSLVEVVLAYPSIRALGIHRVAHFLHRRRVPLIPRMMSEYVHGQTGIDIHPGATIGPGLFIDHGTGVVIGETAVLGRWCKLYQGVTLGALSVVKHG